MNKHMRTVLDPTNDHINGPTKDPLQGLPNYHTDPLILTFDQEQETLQLLLDKNYQELNIPN